jgi:hypothetical protein
MSCGFQVSAGPLVTKIHNIDQTSIFARQSKLSDNLCDPAFGIVAQQILGIDGKLNSGRGSLAIPEGRLGTPPSASGSAGFFDQACYR